MDSETNPAFEPDEQNLYRSLSLEDTREFANLCLIATCLRGISIRRGID